MTNAEALQHNVPASESRTLIPFYLPPSIRSVVSQPTHSSVTETP
jgi:hypothetical protein